MDTLVTRDGTICTMHPEARITYTGYCFVHDPKVDAQIGTLLRSAYQQTANYIYAVFKANTNL
jgi:hypothetical protein